MEEINSWDILSQLANSNYETGQNQNRTLSSMDKTLKDILTNLNKMSASNARTQMGSSRGGQSNSSGGWFEPSNLFRSARSTKSLTDAIEKGIMDELLGEEFKKSMNEIRDNMRDSLEKTLGVPIKDVPNALGEALGKQIAQLGKQKLKGTKFDIDAKFIGPFKDKAQNLAKTFYDKYSSNLNSMLGGKLKSGKSVANATMSDISSEVSPEKVESVFSGVSESATEAMESLSSVGAAGGGADAALTSLTSGAKEIFSTFSMGAKDLIKNGSQIMALLGLLDSLGDAVLSITKLLGTFSKAANRDSESRKKNQELAQRRLEADIKTLVEKPFEILNQAAEAWYAAWDNNLRTITATQGYNKADLQDLYSAYADRLRQDNLSSVVSAADISNNLAKVLESGLSGKVAEEFAYEATKLNAAVPTQDFFSYAETYASIAANAIIAGKSQEQAIAYANEEIEKFASSVLYASRELTGGFSTGLKDAQSIFMQSAQIAQASKIASPSAIASVMTAVSAVTGAVAPDLAQSMTDLVYKAATGGNSSEIVALRSLAGINASNTEFLKKLAENPQEVFANLFTNLGGLQNMSPDAFMEAAEGLSSVFGVSMDALARVDFNYLASVIANMGATNTALADNMELLVSGETTTNAEMLKMQQINKYMIDEGLSYVLDNEAARAIQQHMWDEQRDRQLMENTYAVELKGSALSVLENIGSVVDNVLAFLNPAYALARLIAKGVNAAATAADGVSQSNQLKQVIDLGNVGNANTLIRSRLLERNREYDLIDSLAVLMGGSASGGVGRGLRQLSNLVLNPTALLTNRVTSGLSSGLDGMWGSIGAGVANQFGAYSSNPMRAYQSAYNWNLGQGIVGKSAANLMSGAGVYASGAEVAGVSALAVADSMSATEQAQEKANQSLQTMVDSMESFVKENQSAKFEDWVNTAKTYGIASFTDAIDNAGYTEDALRNQFSSYQTNQAAQEKAEREKREERFWENTVDNLVQNGSYLLQIIDVTGKIQELFESYLSMWSDYYIEHSVYKSAYTSDTVDKILREERDKSETAIYALADALTENDVKLLLDPTVQTNALLAQILKVVNAMLTQQSAGVAGVSLAETIAGLSLGIVNQ